MIIHVTHIFEITNANTYTKMNRHVNFVKCTVVYYIWVVVILNNSM